METTRFRVIFLTSKVVDELEELPKPIQAMIYTAIKERLEIDPIGVGKPLQYSWKGYRRMRINDYRVIYKIDTNKKLVVIAKIGNRKEIYDH